MGNRSRVIGILRGNHDTTVIIYRQFQRCAQERALYCQLTNYQKTIKNKNFKSDLSTLTNQINNLSQDEYKELDFENHNIYRATFKPSDSILRMMTNTPSHPDIPSVPSPLNDASAPLPPPPPSYPNVSQSVLDSIVGSAPDLSGSSGSDTITQPLPYQHEVTYLNRSSDFLENTYEFFLSSDYSKLV